jgi:3-oxoadipate enol-lactonase
LTARLHYTDVGPPTAPAVLLGPSLGATTACWSAQRDTLATRYRVVSYDHRGHGGSEAVEEDCSIADLASDVVALLNELNLARVSYAGVSLGGMVGIWLAAHAPERIENLAVVSASADLGAPDYWQARADIVRAQGLAVIVDAVVGRWFTPAFSSAHPDVVGEFKADFRSTDPGTYAACCEAIGRMDLRADLDEVKVPTLVIGGADDLAIPVAHGRLIADAIPASRLVVVPEAAHLASVEQPGRITDALIGQLRAEEI